MREALWRRILDWAIVKYEAEIERAIEYRNKRLLALTMREHAAKAEYKLTSACQIQTPLGPVIKTKGAVIRHDGEPNWAMAPMNIHAEKIKRAFQRFEGGTVIIGAEIVERNKTIEDRQERSGTMRALYGKTSSELPTFNLPTRKGA